MTTLRPFTCSDMFKFNNVYVKERILRSSIYSIYLFYGNITEIWTHLRKPMGSHFTCNIWLIGPSIFKWLNLQAAKSWDTVNEINCFLSIHCKMTVCLTCIAVMGKAEGHGENWHGHVTALTVSPDYRRLGLAATLMNFLENVSEKYENITKVCLY